MSLTDYIEYEGYRENKTKYFRLRLSGKVKLRGLKNLRDTFVTDRQTDRQRDKETP